MNVPQERDLILAEFQKFRSLELLTWRKIIISENSVKVFKRMFHDTLVANCDFQDLSVFVYEVKRRSGKGWIKQELSIPEKENQQLIERIEQLSVKQEKDEVIDQTWQLNLPHKRGRGRPSTRK